MLEKKECALRLVGGEDIKLGSRCSLAPSLPTYLQTLPAPFHPYLSSLTVQPTAFFVLQPEFSRAKGLLSQLRAGGANDHVTTKHHSQTDAPHRIRGPLLPSLPLIQSSRLLLPCIRKFTLGVYSEPAGSDYSSWHG